MDQVLAVLPTVGRRTGDSSQSPELGLRSPVSHPAEPRRGRVSSSTSASETPTYTPERDNTGESQTSAATFLT